MGGNAITDHLFKLLLDVLADNKYYMIEACFDCIMNRIVHDDVIRSIHWLQLYTRSKRLPIPAAIISNVVFIAFSHFFSIKLILS